MLVLSQEQLLVAAVVGRPTALAAAPGAVRRTLPCVCGGCAVCCAWPSPLADGAVRRRHLDAESLAHAVLAHVQLCACKPRTAPTSTQLIAPCNQRKLQRQCVRVPHSHQRPRPAPPFMLICARDRARQPAHPYAQRLCRCQPLRPSPVAAPKVANYRPNQGEPVAPYSTRSKSQQGVLEGCKGADSFLLSVKAPTLAKRPAWQNFPFANPNHYP